MSALERITEFVFGALVFILLLPVLLSAVIWLPPLLVFGSNRSLDDTPIYVRVLKGILEVCVFWTFLFFTAGTSWITFAYFGPGFPIPVAFLSVALWLGVAGVPLAMSGSKVEVIGFRFTIVSNLSVIILSVYTLISHAP